MAPRESSRRKRRALYGAIGVGICGAVLIGVLATRSVPPGAVATTTLLGKTAPSISGVSIASNNRVSLTGLRGRYVLVDFFASWCQPCMEEIPQLEAFLFQHRSGVKVSILGVDIDDSAANGASFLRRTGASWPAIEDTSGSIALRYGVADPPQSFLVAPSGRVVARVLDGVSVGTLNELMSDAEARSPS